MAVQQNDILKNLDLNRINKAHQRFRGMETPSVMANLPAGIKGGVAELKTVSLKTYDKGKKYEGMSYVVFRGVALSPESHNGSRVRGLGVMLTIPLCDTPDKKNQDGSPKMLEDNYRDLLGEVMKFGVKIDTTPDASAILKILEVLQQKKPQFGFSTRGWTPPQTPEQARTGQIPEEMVFTTFEGTVTQSAKPVAKPPVVDNTPQAPPSANGDTHGDTTEPTEIDILHDLVSRCDQGDEDAKTELAAMAEKYGVDQQEFVDAKTWQDSGALILAAMSASPEPEPEAPKSGGVRTYAPVDAKGKKGKPVKCQITAVDMAEHTVTLKNLASPKVIYKNVPWSDLGD